MKNIIHKIIATIDDWWTGDPIIPPLEEIQKMTGETVLEYKRPITRRILTAIWQFWLRHWPTLLTIFVGATIALFIHFDSKPNGQP